MSSNPGTKIQIISKLKNSLVKTDFLDKISLLEYCELVRFRFDLGSVGQRFGLGLGFGLALS